MSVPLLRLAAALCFFQINNYHIIKLNVDRVLLQMHSNIHLDQA